MLGKKIINTGGVACTTDTAQILDGGTTDSVALYRFEDNANDTASSTGKFGKGAIFTSALTTRIDLSSNAAFAKSNDFSLSMWFYIDTMASGDNQTILAYNTNLTPRYFIMFNNGNIGNIRFYGGGSTNRYSANNLFSAGSWYHLAVSKSSTAGLVVYLNGTAVITQTGETAAYTNGSQANSKNCIGAYYAANSHLYQFKGKIDQFRVFNKPITQAEVNTLYAETSSTVNTLQILGDTSCIATYTFEGNADDLSNNYDGVATSDVAYDYSGTASNVTYAAGKFDKSAVFNTNGLITVSSALPWTNSFSISMWLKPSSGLSASNYYIPFYQKGYDSSIGGTGLAFYIYGYTLRPWVGSISGSYYNIFNTGTLTANQWNHVVLTRNYGVAWELFLNGSSLGTYTAQGLTNDFSDTEYYFGGYFGGNYGYIGEIDQARIFSKALSPGEINNLYNETTTTAALGTITNPSTIAYYKMADATDETGSYDGTVTNVDFNVQGKYGFAGNFNGLNSSSRSKIITSNLPTYNNYSISFWMNPRDVTSDADILMGTSDNYSSAIGFGLYTGHPNDGDLTWAICDGSSRLNVIASGLSANQWHHVVVTQNISNNEKKIYIDNTLKTTSTSTINNTNVTYSLIIGGYQTYNNSAYDGKLDQIRIFNKAISASEVTKLYNEVQCANTITAPESYFNTKLYTGNSGTQSITGVGFQPDLVWIKSRNNNYSPTLYDSVRGTGTSKAIYSNENVAENTYPTLNNFVSFDTNGFTLGATSHTNNIINKTSDNLVSWNWKAATSNTINNDGTIQSTVRASQESGFSIVKWTGSGTNGDTVGHGLASTGTSMLVIMKDLGATNDWMVITNNLWSSPNQQYLKLNTSAGVASSGADIYNVNNTTFKNDYRNTSGNEHIAYCFANVDGYQRVGSYVGNSSTNGPFIYTGFEPAFILVKGATSSYASHWMIIDNKRDTDKEKDKRLLANLSNIETDDANWKTEFYSNGFQPKSTFSGYNHSSGNYIFLAIAANPDTTAPTKANSFKTKIHTGNGGTQSITGVGFKPDFTWIKSRDTADNNNLGDSVRGVQKFIYSNLTSQELTSANYLTSFDADGFSVGSDNSINKSSDSIVSWNWKALDHDRNLASINTDGTIPSLVSVNRAAGFSIIKYVGNATSGASIGHGLGVKPDLVIFKNIDQGGNYHWSVYSNTSATGATGLLYLNLNDAFTTTSSRFNNTEPTTSVITLGNDGTINNSGNNHIAYCWHSVSGHSSIGSYNGNGSATGPSVTVGFRPSWVLIKKTSSTGGWYIFDAVRAGSTTAFPKMLYANLNNVEYDTTGTAYDGMVITTTATTFEVDFSSAWTDLNASGTTYLYMAFK
jgi:hypothetical protein